MKKLIAIALLLILGSMSVVRADMYDCTPAPEPVVHHFKRVIHNLLNPHHKHVYMPVKPQMCGEPTMEEVVVTAMPDPELAPPDDGTITNSFADNWPDGVVVWPVAVYVPVTGNDPPPTSVPEPSPIPLFATGILAIYLSRRFSCVS